MPTPPSALTRLFPLSLLGVVVVVAALRIALPVREGLADCWSVLEHERELDEAGDRILLKSIRNAKETARIAQELLAGRLALCDAITQFHEATMVDWDSTRWEHLRRAHVGLTDKECMARVLLNVAECLRRLEGDKPIQVARAELERQFMGLATRGSRTSAALRGVDQPPERSHRCPATIMLPSLHAW